MSTYSRRRFVRDSSLALLAAQLPWIGHWGNGFIGSAQAKELPKGWNKAIGETALFCTALYLKGRDGHWFPNGAKAGDMIVKNPASGGQVEFVTHGRTSKKWLLAKNEAAKTYFLVFRGTDVSRPEDIGADALFTPTLLPADLKGNATTILDPRAYTVPDGFLRYWKALVPEINHLAVPYIKNPGWKTVVTGFSLGGVFALYAAWYLDKVRNVGYIASVYTFGAPPSANINYVRAIASNVKHIYRIVGNDDPIPGVKPLWPHVGNLLAVGFTGGHNIANYQRNILAFAK